MSSIRIYSNTYYYNESAKLTINVDSRSRNGCGEGFLLTMIRYPQRDKISCTRTPYFLPYKDLNMLCDYYEAASTAVTIQKTIKNYKTVLADCGPPPLLKGGLKTRGLILKELGRLKYYEDLMRPGINYLNENKLSDYSIPIQCPKINERKIGE